MWQTSLGYLVVVHQNEALHETSFIKDKVTRAMLDWYAGTLERTGPMTGPYLDPASISNYAVDDGGAVDEGLLNAVH